MFLGKLLVSRHTYIHEMLYKNTGLLYTTYTVTYVCRTFQPIKSDICMYVHSLNDLAVHFRRQREYQQL